MSTSTRTIDHDDRGGHVLARRARMLQSFPPGTRAGHPPALLLLDPKYPHNVGAVVRAAACYSVAQVWMTGSRVPLDPSDGFRLPREERMRSYADVTLFQCDRPLEQFAAGITPVAVEFNRRSERLPDFEHPERPLYVFGPEDGSIPTAMLGLCHRFVCIPSRHCLSLSAAVYTVLYDRACKMGWSP